MNDSLKYWGISWINYFFWGKSMENFVWPWFKQRYLPELVPVFLSKLSTGNTFCHTTSLHIVRKTGLQLRNFVKHSGNFQPKNLVPGTPKSMIPNYDYLYTKSHHLLETYLIQNIYLIWGVKQTSKHNPPANMWSIIINGSTALNSIEWNINFPKTNFCFPQWFG